MHSQQKNDADHACIRNTPQNARPAVVSTKQNPQYASAVPAAKERPQRFKGVCHVSHEGTVGTEYANAVNHTMRADATIEQASSAWASDFK